MTTPPTTSPPQVFALTFHVTLTFVEYDALCCTSGTVVSMFASLASLPTSSMPKYTCTSFSTLWIIDLEASTHMTKTPTILSSYQLTLTHPLVTIVDGQTYPHPLSPSPKFSTFLVFLPTYCLLVLLLVSSSIPLHFFSFHYIF